MTSNKRQKITEVMSLLDEEKEALRSNTYLRFAEHLNDAYKAADVFYVLTWMSIVPVVDDGDVVYEQTPCRATLPLTLEQVARIQRLIRSGTSSSTHKHCSFWENIGYTSVPLFKQNLPLGEDYNVHETSVIMSLVEYTGPTD